MAFAFNQPDTLAKNLAKRRSREQQGSPRSQRDPLKSMLAQNIEELTSTGERLKAEINSLKLRLETAKGDEKTRLQEQLEMVEPMYDAQKIEELVGKMKELIRSFQAFGKPATVSAIPLASSSQVITSGSFS